MGVEISVSGFVEVQELLRNMPDTVFENTKKVFGKNVRTIHKKVLSQLKDASSPLVNRTGALARSIRTSNKGNDINTLYSAIYTDSKYAPVHELGSTGLLGGPITAKRAYSNVPGGPYLNIPLSNNKTEAGVMRESAREIFNAGGYIMKSKRGNWLVMKPTGMITTDRDGRKVNVAVPMFVLKKSVSIPARLKMLITADEEMPTLLSSLNQVILDGVS